MSRHRSALRVLLLSSAAFVAAAGPGLAQSAIELQTVVVEGDVAAPAGGVADPAPVDGYVATDATAGAKTATPIEEIPQSVSVIGREELDDRAVQKVDEALRYTPGVVTQPFGYDSDTDWVYIRGFDATQTGMFLDGLQLYSYAFAGISVDPFLLDRIEVQRGPSSVLFGGSNAGGIVNSITKRANGERIRYLEAGVDDTPNGYVAADIGDRFGEGSPWSYRLIGKVKGGDTQTEHADNFRGVVAPSLLFEPGEDTRLEIYGFYQQDDQKHVNGFLPYMGSVVAAPYGFVPRDFYYSEPGLDEFEARQAAIGYEFEHEIMDGFTVRSNARWLRVEREEYGPYPFEYGLAAGDLSAQMDDVLTRTNFAHDTSADLVQTDNHAVVEFDTFGMSHEALVGFSYDHYRIDQWQATGLAPAIDPINPVYTNALPPLGAPYADEVISLDRFGLYMQDQMKFGDGWILTLNGRQDAVWIDRDDMTAFDNDYDGDETALSGRAGIAYEFDNGLVPYASVSHFFNPQIGTDAFGDPVDSQTGDQYEAGLKYVPGFMPAVFTASVFDLTRRNTLQTKRDATGIYVTDTIGEVQSRGIELEAKANLTPGLKLTAAFTTYELEILDDVNTLTIGKRPTLVPETLASLWLDYTVQQGAFEGLGFGAGVRYQGESYADELNTLEVPDATVVDAAIHYDRDNWGVSLNVTNLFDEDYVSGCGDVATCGYGEGRKALLKTHVRF